MKNKIMEVMVYVYENGLNEIREMPEFRNASEAKYTLKKNEVGYIDFDDLRFRIVYWGE